MRVKNFFAEIYRRKNLITFKKGIIIFVVFFGTILGVTSKTFAIKMYKLETQADISIEWIKHANGQPITSVTYDPSAPKDLPIKIAVKFTGEYCPASIGIRGIRIGNRAPVYPPIVVPRPNRHGISYIRTHITIPKGLQPGRKYSFEVFKLVSDQCPDSNPENNRKVIRLRLLASSDYSSDYRIEAITLADGRPLDVGCLYSPDMPLECPIKIKVKWNKVNPPHGVACTITGWIGFQNHRYPLGNFPVPDQNGVSEMTHLLRLPRGKSPGSVLHYTLRLVPSDPACDSNPRNNFRRFNIKLIRMSGNDFVIRIKGPFKWQKRWIITDGWIWEEVKFKVRVANVSGTDTWPKHVEVRAWHSASSYDQSLALYKTKFSLNVKPKQWYEKEVRLILGGMKIYDPLKICAEVVYSGVEIDKNNNKVCVYEKP